MGAAAADALPRKTREQQWAVWDSTRLNDFAWRDDDILICTWSKAGTTWVQQLVAQLVRRALSDTVSVALHYRFYFDDWSLSSHTVLGELGWTAYLMKDYAKAKDATQKAIAHQPAPNIRGAALYNLGLIDEAQHDTAGAVAAAAKPSASGTIWSR